MAEWQRRREPPAALGLVLVALVLVAVVALASRAHRVPGGTGTAHLPSARLLDDVTSVAALVFLVGVVVFLRVAYLRRNSPSVGRGSRRELLTLIVFLALVALALLVVQRRAHVRPSSPTPLHALPSKVKPPPSARAAEPYHSSFRWLPFAAAGGLLVLAAAGVAVLRVRRRARLPGLAELSLEDALALVLDDALDDLRRERDVRRAIVAAYARMERLLRAHGLGRAAWEAPVEYLERVLGELAASRGSVARLTRLFERAKFSRQELGPDAKDDAIGALESLRAELGGVR